MLCFIVSPHASFQFYFIPGFVPCHFLLALSHTHLPSALQHIYPVVLCCVSEDRVGVLYSEFPIHVYEMGHWCKEITLITVFISGTLSQERGDGWMATVVNG